LLTPGQALRVCESLHSKAAGLEPDVVLETAAINVPWDAAVSWVRRKAA
jgi:hypothetical protein